MPKSIDWLLGKTPIPPWAKRREEDIELKDPNETQGDSILRKLIKSRESLRGLTETIGKPKRK